MTLFRPLKPSLPFKTFEELQEKLRSGECRLITTDYIVETFGDQVANLNATSKLPVEMWADSEVMRISEYILNRNNSNECVVGMHYYTAFFMESYRNCNLLLFDFNQKRETLVMVVRDNFPYLNQMRLAFSFSSQDDLYERLLKKYASLLYITCLVRIVLTKTYSRDG